MRDPERIPLVLAAVERQWRKDSDARLGQVIVNLLRLNRNVPYEDESRVLFNVEDGELLSWIEPKTEEERRYIDEEPRKAREGCKNGSERCECGDPGQTRIARRIWNGLRNAIMEAWRAVRARPSFTGGSSAAPKRFGSALPSRYDRPTRRASVKETLGQRMTPLKGGEARGGRTD